MNYTGYAAQVERHNAGVTSYAYKLEGTTDPLEEELLWLPDPEETASIPAGYEAYYMTMHEYGTTEKTGQGPWGTCYICRYDYPVSQMLLKNGRYYCYAQKCYEEML